MSVPTIFPSLWNDELCRWRMTCGWHFLIGFASWRQENAPSSSQRRSGTTVAGTTAGTMMPNRRQNDPTNGAVEISTMEPGNILRITEVIGPNEPGMKLPATSAGEVAESSHGRVSWRWNPSSLRITLHTVSLSQVDWELPRPNFWIFYWCVLSGKKKRLARLVLSWSCWLSGQCYSEVHDLTLSQLDSFGMIWHRIHWSGGKTSSMLGEVCCRHKMED